MALDIVIGFRQCDDVVLLIVVMIVMSMITDSSIEMICDSKDLISSKKS